MTHEADAPGTVAADCPQTMKVGEHGEAFPYWAAKEALKAAEIALVETDRSRESLGKTATSLIGWALPLSIVFGGAVLAQKLGLPQRAAAGVGFLMTTAAVMAAFQALRVRDWANASLSPSQWFSLIEEPPADASAFFITLQRLNSIEAALHKNDQLVEGNAKHVRRAWGLLLAMPAMAFIAALLMLLIF